MVEMQLTLFFYQTKIAMKNQNTELSQEEKVKTIVVLIAIIGLIVYWIWPSETEPISIPKPLTVEEKREQLVKHCFSVWDGSHIKLIKFIKSNRNDPESFEHIETLYGDYGDTLIVGMRYRGKNQFGGKVPAFVKVKTSTISCEILEVIQ